jgi:hypothetical protein
MALVTFTNLTAGKLGLSKPSMILNPTGSPGDSKTLGVTASDLLDNPEANTLKAQGKLGIVVGDDPALANELEELVKTDAAAADALTVHLAGTETITGLKNFTPPTYSGTASAQPVASDLTLGAAAGKNQPDTAFLSPVMGNLQNAAPLTKTGNVLGGVIGEDSVSGTQLTRQGKGGVVGIIGDGVTETDAAMLAVLDGDSGAVNGKAMFGVKSNNSTPASGTDFGMDLSSPAHDGYLAVDSAFYKKAPLRLVNDVCTLVGAAVPTDGVAGTGAGVAGPGSDYRCTGTPGIYINTNTKASPTWVAL